MQVTDDMPLPHLPTDCSSPELYPGPGFRTVGDNLAAWSGCARRSQRIFLATPCLPAVARFCIARERASGGEVEATAPRMARRARSWTSDRHLDTLSTMERLIADLTKLTPPSIPAISPRCSTVRDNDGDRRRSARAPRRTGPCLVGYDATNCLPSSRDALATGGDAPRHPRVLRLCQRSMVSPGEPRDSWAADRGVLPDAAGNAVEAGRGASRVAATAVLSSSLPPEARNLVRRSRLPAHRGLDGRLTLLLSPVLCRARGPATRRRLAHDAILHRGPTRALPDRSPGWAGGWSPRCCGDRAQRPRGAHVTRPLSAVTSARLEGDTGDLTHRVAGPDASGQGGPRLWERLQHPHRVICSFHRQGASAIGCRRWAASPVVAPSSYTLISPRLVHSRASASSDEMLEAVRTSTKRRI